MAYIIITIKIVIANVYEWLYKIVDFNFQTEVCCKWTALDFVFSLGDETTKNIPGFCH